MLPENVTVLSQATTLRVDKERLTKSEAEANELANLCEDEKVELETAMGVQAKKCRLLQTNSEALERTLADTKDLFKKKQISLNSQLTNTITDLQQTKAKLEATKGETANQIAALQQQVIRVHR